MISIYSDGSSGQGRNKPGGYGWIIVRGDEVLAWGYGGSPSTTNNLMEAEGAICGLAAAIDLGLHESGEAMELVCDSQYTLGIASKTYHPSANLEQAQRLQEVAARARVRFRWVRGHNGDKYNEMCDKLAGEGKLENTPEDQRKKVGTKKQQRQERRRKVRDAQRKAEGSDGPGSPDPGAA